MSFLEYLFLRFEQTWIAKIFCGIIVIPLLIVALPFIIIVAPFVWVSNIYNEWKEFAKEDDNV